MMKIHWQSDQHFCAFYLYGDENDRQIYEMRTCHSCLSFIYTVAILKQFICLISLFRLQFVGRNTVWSIAFAILQHLFCPISLINLYRCGQGASLDLGTGHIQVIGHQVYFYWLCNFRQSDLLVASFYFRVNFSQVLSGLHLFCHWMSHVISRIFTLMYSLF